MNEIEARKAMKKLFGSKAAWRVNKKALTGEERDELKTKLPEFTAAQKTAADAMEARRAKLLKDPEYLRLVAVAKQARKESDEARGKYYSRRITVGLISDMGFFHVKGEGDNWAEAIRKAKGDTT